MSVFEKIAFLESFFKVFEIDQQVQLHSEVEIDYLIKRINDQIKFGITWMLPTKLM